MKIYDEIYQNYDFYYNYNVFTFNFFNIFQIKFIFIIKIFIKKKYLADVKRVNCFHY